MLIQVREFTTVSSNYKIQVREFTTVSSKFILHYLSIGYVMLREE